MQHQSKMFVQLLAICAIVAPTMAQQLASWAPPTHLHQPHQQFVAAAQQPSQLQLQPRQPIQADLQNQVQALSAQIAAANRQLQYFQQQLSMANQQPVAAAQQQAQPATAPVHPGHLLAQQQQQHQHPSQHQLHHQHQFQAQPQHQAQQFFGAPQPAQPQFQHQPQPAPVSTLVDGDTQANQLGADPRLAGQPQQVYYQHQQQQQAQPEQQAQPGAFIDQQRLVGASQHQMAPVDPTSTTVGPPALEQPSLAQPQPQQQQQQQQQHTQPQQAPPADMAPVHSGPRNDDKFSIGLGVLSPGYTQKFGNTALDFNQDKNGFSFTLSNNGHTNQTPQQQQQQPKTGQTVSA